MRRPALRWIVPVVGLAALSLGADYRGCGASAGADADEGVALPVASGCLLDADCVSVDMCSQVRCLVGECVVMGLAVDRDGDGFAPAPCGMDCEDSSADRFPGAVEACDGIDQDCDGVVDEGAIGASAFALSDGLDNTTLVAAGEDLWVLGDSEPGPSLIVYPIEDSRPGLMQPLPLDVGQPRGAVGFEDGRIVVVGPSEAAAFTVYELRRLGVGSYSVASQEDVGDPADLLALHVRRVGTDLFVVYDIQTDRGPQRWLLHPVAGPIELSPNPEGTPPDLAFDGSRLAVTSGRQTLQFLSSAGAPLAARDLPGGFAERGLADGDGLVIAAYRDAFDHALTLVGLEGRNPAVLAPAGERMDALSVHRIEQGVLVLRQQEMGLAGWVLSEDLSTYRATFRPDRLTDIPATITDITVAVRSDGLAAVHAQRPFGSDSVAYLTCEAR